MVFVPFRDRFQSRALLLSGLAVAACGGRSGLLEENGAAVLGGSGGAAQGGTHDGSGASIDPAVGGAWVGAGGSSGSPWQGAGGAQVCGDGRCDLAETGEACATDCTGSCAALADLTPWVNGPAFLSTGFATINSVRLPCEPHGTDGAELAFYVQMPTGGRLTVSTESPFTNFDTVLALGVGDCLGRNVACNDDANGSLQSRATAWYEANERAVIIVEAYDGIVGQFALTLEFEPGGFGDQSSGAVVGSLGACSTASRDVWGIDLVSGERVNVAVDSVGANSAADFSLSVINLTEGRISEAPFEFRCSHGPPDQQCPLHEFEAATSGPYALVVGLETPSCGPALPAYELRVQRQGGGVSLRLLEDG